MYEILVLGHIPGTNLTINFSVWAIGVAIVLGFVLARKISRSKTLGSAVISSAMFIAVRARRMRA